MAEYTYTFTQADGAPAGFTVVTGEVSVIGNQLVLADGGVEDIVVSNDVLTVNNYEVDCDFTPGASYGSGQRFGMLFGYTAFNTFYFLAVKTGAFGGAHLYRRTNQGTVLVGSDPLFGSRNIANNTLHNFKVAVSYGQSQTDFEVFLNDVSLYTASDVSGFLSSPGQIGVIQNLGTGDDIVADNLHVIEGNATPTVTIAESTQTVMAEKDAVTYSFTANATASDQEDGDLTASIVWETALNGGGYSQIGSGATVTYAFPIGSNAIRATVEDSALASSFDEITLTVNAFDFGGTTPVANGFIIGIGGTHTPDEYTGNGINLMITRHPTNAKIFARADGTVAVFPNSPADTSITFDYRIEDQEGVSNESTITINIST